MTDKTIEEILEKELNKHVLVKYYPETKTLLFLGPELETNLERFKLTIKVLKLSDSAKLPTKADGDMCYDVYADEDKLVKNGEITTVKTGIKISPPEGYHYSVRDRSGLAAKHGLHIVAGQIDNSYRGELLICLTKFKIEFQDYLTHLEGLDTLQYASTVLKPIHYEIKKGDKIAQIKFEEDTTFPVVEVQSEEDLGYTERGEKSFGSSGR